ncbi:head GIN domain-containing protein [Limibacterium fermenti]|jgi:hypothetical protein|uniref:head GIN domain-containing protein n=1 Tax=Limibacterium fermenti TaxID=3229863 RepID=UPI00269C9A39
MKTKIIVFFTVMAAVMCLSTACAQSRITSKNFPVRAFLAIESNSVGNLHIRQGSDTQVRAEGDDEMIKKLDIRVEQGTLVIDMEKTIVKKWKRNTKLDIYITTPSLSKLEQDGVGNVVFTGTVNVPKLEISSDGVGNISSDELICDDLIIESDGVGNIQLAGKTQILSVYSDGVGNVNTENLIAAKAKIISNGVGNVRCYATEEVDISAGGVGNVTYFGNPASKYIRKGGIGKVKAGD